jgi:hypothetical protein
MTEHEDRLQIQLEKLENGASLPALTAELPPEDAELLQLAAALRQMEMPARNPDQVAAQKAAVIDLAQGQETTSPPFWQTLLAWMRGHQNAVAAAAAIAVLALLLLVSRTRPQPEAMVDTEVDPTEPAVLVSPGDADTAVSEAAPTDLSPDAAEESDPAPADTAVEDDPYRVFLPAIDNPGMVAAGDAALRDIVGLVEVQQGEEAWTAVSQTTVLHSGDRVRTGALSAAHLHFFDGSQSALGPNSEISLDTVDAQRPETGFRTVVLSQPYGESEHWVQFRNDAGSRYEVKTPTGQGVARGTAFRVTVAADGEASYTVTEGRVDVSNQNRTVQVTAGQMTSFTAGAPPAAPTFLVTGEGIVSEMGDVWLIAGQPFAVDDETEIVGEPQIGDLVRVVGHLQDDGPPLADRIELVRPSPRPSFHLTGIAQTIGEDAWVIAGQTISVTAETEIDEAIVAGDRVRASGTILGNGALQADEIQRWSDDEARPFEFTGVVQASGAEEWMISGVAIAVAADTEIKGEIEVGDLVKVEGYIQDDGVWLADEIKLEEPDDATFSISGAVDSIAPWRVNGISFVTESFTIIDPGVEVGDMVRVNGRILADGTWVAYTIEKLDFDDALLQIVFVGPVDAIDPWVVNGLPLVTDEDTLIDPGIEIGDLVRVAALIRNDGAWLATKIEALDVEIDPGCVTVTAVITAINGNEIVTGDGQTIILGPDIVVEGELQVGSVVLIVACAAEEGAITIIAITVIADPPPPQPTPPPPPPGDGGDDGDNGGDVTICHKPGTPAEQTKTIPRAALDAHLGHGDTMGPCP